MFHNWVVLECSAFEACHTVCKNVKKGVYLSEDLHGGLKKSPKAKPAVAVSNRPWRVPLVGYLQCGTKLQPLPPKRQGGVKIFVARPKNKFLFA